MSNRRRSNLAQRQHKGARPGCPRCRSDAVKRMSKDGVPDFMACGECGAGWPVRDADESSPGGRDREDVTPRVPTSPDREVAAAPPGDQAAGSGT